MIDEGINHKFHSMGVLLLLDCPEGLQFGIDNINWRIGNKFKGIKLIPLGTHIIAYSMKSQNYMFKVSRFIIFDAQNKVHVLKWNEEAQEFLQVRGQEGSGYKEGVRQYHFDSHLGPYPNENLSFWSQTTKYITKKVLQRLDPIDKIQQFNQQYSQNKNKKEEDIAMSNLTLEDEDGQEQIINEENDEDEEANQNENEKQTENPGRFKVLSDTIYYTTIPRFLTFKPEEITKINMDKTAIMKKVLKEWKNEQEHLLGELQYSFVHFIIGQEQQSLNQWKKLIDLFITSESAYYSIQQSSKDINLQKLVMDFIPIFYDQLNQFPNDFFRDELSKDNFMSHLLIRLHEYSRGEQYSSKLKKRIQKLLVLVKNKFDFVVFDEGDNNEDNPMVVQERQSYF